MLSLRRMLPAGSLVARRGLPAVIGTRGLLSASFFCSEAYIVFVLQDRWDLTPGTAGLALTAVGLTWAAASQVQSRLGSRVSDVTAMRWGIALVLAGTAALLLVVLSHAAPVLAVAAYVVSGAGMGFGYPRTGVAMLAASTDADRGFNSSALSIADSLGGALVAVAVRDRLRRWPTARASTRSPRSSCSRPASPHWASSRRRGRHRAELVGREHDVDAGDRPPSTVNETTECSRPATRTARRCGR